MNVLRYGMTRDLVPGLEVVLSDGRIGAASMCWQGNRGYDLKQLFIGSEGTLGVGDSCGVQAVPEACPGRDRAHRASLGG